MPHGNLTASCQFNNAFPLALDGIINKVIAAMMAIIVSSIAGINCFNKNDRHIHAIAVAINTINTSFSSLDMGPNSSSCLDMIFFPPGNFSPFNGKANLPR